MRWWKTACAAACISVALAQPAAGQTTSLAGVIDFHVHSGPDSRPRSVSDLEIARIAKRAGMRGLVLKNHFTMTADRAWLAMQEVPGLEIFGGVALNHSVGGLNAEAVRQLAAFSGGRGKVVWLPTFDAEFWMTRAATPGRPCRSCATARWTPPWARYSTSSPSTTSCWRWGTRRPKRCWP